MSLLRETPRSLRLYFLLVGGYWLLSGSVSMLFAHAAGGWLDWTHAIITIGFGATFFASGVLLQRSLRTRRLDLAGAHRRCRL